MGWRRGIRPADPLAAMAGTAPILRESGWLGRDWRVQMENADAESLRLALSQLERQFDAVRRVAVSLSTATEVEDVVREALKISLTLAGSDAGSILLYHPTKQKLVFEYVAGEKADELMGVALDPEQGIAGAVFQSGKTLVSDDVASERVHMRELDARIGHTTRNMVTVPLLSSKTVPLGVMQVLNKRGARFDESDVRLIEIIASQIAVALETVHLHQEARLATVVRFIGNISHDVKNMVTPAVVGAETLKLIADECFRKLDECQERQGEAEDRTASLLGALTELRELYPEILEMILEGCDAVQQRMAQIAGAVKGIVSAPHFEPTDIPSVASRIGALLSLQAQRKGVTLAIEKGCELPLAWVDARQVYNLLYNLVLNAIDACSEGDSIALRFDGRSEGEFPGGDYFAIECADTGPGIPEKVKARLFTDEAVSTKPMGTGLGTRIIGNVVDAHRGTIEVQSEVGVGTKIRCLLPLTSNTASPAASPDQ
jgi:signal transduction histidine kinase